MSDIDGIARNENGENGGIIEAGSVFGAVLDLEAETESVSTRARQVTGHITHLCTGERGMRASGVSDTEAVPGERTQDTTRVVEEFEGLVTGISDGRGDLQVLQTIDLDVGDRCLDGQARVSSDGDGRGDESDEGSTERRGEHRGEGSEGDKDG